MTAATTLQQLGLHRLAEANINPRTGLATDYLNHYNEVAMMIDMLPSMPEAAEDILAWRSIPYKEHFESTGFRAKDLAAAAYDAADPAVRAAFSNACAAIETEIKEAQNLLSRGVIDAQSAAVFSETLYDLISRVAGIINGEADAQALDADPQQDVDALFP